MENKDAKTVLNSIAQERPPPKSWRDEADKSPEFIRLMEEVERVQARAGNSTTRPGLQARPLSVSTAHRILRFSDASMEAIQRDLASRSSPSTTSAGRFVAPSRTPSVTSASTPSPTSSYQRDSYASRMTSAEAGRGEDFIRRLDARTTGNRSAAAHGSSAQPSRDLRFGQYDSLQERTLASRDVVSYARRTIISPRETSPTVVSLLDEDESDEADEDMPELAPVNRNAISVIGAAFQNRTAQQDDMDASERLARELYAAEVAENLQRMHEEQQRILTQLRSAGDAEIWQESDEDDGVEESEEMSYDELLELGERIGDVRTERWREKSAQVSAKLPRITFDNMRRTLPMYRDDMCVICQFSFESTDELKLMPNCTHAFHGDCADAWIKDHDRCATCKAPVE